MRNTSKILRQASLAILTAAVVLLVAGVGQAQRDPFKKAGWSIPKKVAAPGSKSAGPAVAVNYGPPPIDARIEYYKRIREQAAAAGNPLPKVTSVLTLNEMTVSGIFKTPRGWAAMVQATPINLSYTVYPGEKFFDGQLVAIEENRLVFKRVTKVGEGKFVASVENKPLRQFTMQQQATGVAPAGANGGTGKEEQTVTAANQQAQPPADGSAPAEPKTAKAKQPANPFLSPLDEMNSQPDKKDDKKTQKKPTKVARNGK
ncbi:MAG: hypothetical protein JO314_11255 [Acidobacteria bacterium]|nr:hypothetical protein [Acidobacteriota bacterium]